MGFVSLEDANTYFEGRIGAEAWGSADDAIKRNALEMAHRRINSLPYRGHKLDDTQPLAFPRRMLSHNSGEIMIFNEPPQAVRDAICEEALYLIESHKIDMLRDHGVKSYSLGDEAITLDARSTPVPISNEAYMLLAGYLGPPYRVI